MLSAILPITRTPMRPPGHAKAHSESYWIMRESRRAGMRHKNTGHGLAKAAFRHITRILMLFMILQLPA